MKKKDIKHIAWIFYSFCVCTILWSALLPDLMGQSLSEDFPKEQRSYSIYDEAGTQLLEKYEYYFDYWAQQKVRHGLHTRWNKKGNLKHEVRFSHNERSGEEVLYQKNGNPRRRIMWVDGEREGKDLRYDRSGRIRREISFREGIKSGLQKKWFPNGQLKSVRIYREGEEPSPAIRYKRNGSLKKKEKRHPEKPSKTTQPALKVPSRTTLKT